HVLQVSCFPFRHYPHNPLLPCPIQPSADIGCCHSILPLRPTLASINKQISLVIAPAAIASLTRVIAGSFTTQQFVPSTAPNWAQMQSVDQTCPGQHP
ncbi:hypothetical protein H6G97_45580, partial [Nostoc flagelliforme FACHB-838]